MSCSDIFLGLIAVLFPPVAVWIKSGICSADSFINILLCILGFIPGLIHAWYIIAKYPEHDHDYEPIDAEAGRRRRQGGGGGRVTYRQVSREQQSQGSRGYGTPNQGLIQAPNAPAKKPTKNNSGAAGSGAPGASQPAGPSREIESNDQGAPPSYNEVVRGDHKIQSRD